MHWFRATREAFDTDFARALVIYRRKRLLLKPFQLSRRTNIYLFPLQKICIRPTLMLRCCSGQMLSAKMRPDYNLRGFRFFLETVEPAWK